MARLQMPFFDELIIDKRAVRRPAISHVDTVARQRHFAVQTGDRRVVQLEVISLCPPKLVYP